MKYAALINAAEKALSSAKLLLENEATPINTIFRQYKLLQSLWMRMIEEASDSNMRKLEDLCVSLEMMVDRYADYLKAHPKPSSKEAENSDVDEEDIDAQIDAQEEEEDE